MRIAAAQLNMIPADRAANFAAAERWLENNIGKSEEKTVVLLPEMFDIGYEISRAEELADDNAKIGFNFLSKTAKKHNITLIGTVLARVGHELRNRALAVNERGELIAQYDKVHLVPIFHEDKILTSGDKLCVFDLGEVKAAIVTCYDLRFCEWERACALHGAEILFIPASWPERRVAHWSALLRARAIENAMFVVGCNMADNEAGVRCGGDSAVFDPWGNALYEAGKGESGKDAVVSIDTKIIKTIREDLKIFDMRRPELYKKYL